jgi:peptidoglycan/xylan/chitin deacetylase (PgdA/CDA1 family)
MAITITGKKPRTESALKCMTGLRHWLRWSWACSLRASGALRFVEQRLKKSRAIIVLGLHRVLDDAEYGRTDSLTGMLLRRKTFDKLAAYTARRLETVDILESRPDSESRRLRCAFTFDDGWSDNYSTALPITRAYKAPMTIFLCPGLLGKIKPFWPERIAAGMKVARPTASEAEVEEFIEHLKKCSVAVREDVTATLAGADRCGQDEHIGDSTLSWKEIREMDALGVRFGAHTQTHQVLTNLSTGQARREIAEAKATLEEVLQKPCRVFAYPNGNHSENTRRLLAEAGFSLAFTTSRGVWTEASDPLAVPRMILDETDVVTPLGRFSPSLFEYTVFWKSWRAMRASGGSN